MPGRNESESRGRLLTSLTNKTLSRFKFYESARESTKVAESARESTKVAESAREREFELLSTLLVSVGLKNAVPRGLKLDQFSNKMKKTGKKCGNNIRANKDTHLPCLVMEASFFHLDFDNFRRMINNLLW